MTFFVPHFGQRRCRDIFIVYSDILELSERGDGDGRHLEAKMQKLEEFQWTGKLLHAWTQAEHDALATPTSINIYRAFSALTG